MAILGRYGQCGTMAIQIVPGKDWAARQIRVIDSPYAGTVPKQEQEQGQEQ